MSLDSAYVPTGQIENHPFKIVSGETVTMPSSNRFEDFFADAGYVSLKNHLYNYLLRRRAIRKCMQLQKKDLILEVGSGLSPMLDGSERIVYSELSFSALKTLKKNQVTGIYVVADATHLPFKAGSFSQVICSEVLEHLPDDRPALREMASVMKIGGSLIITFPHRKNYFACDDHFVCHFRRYELLEMLERLKDVELDMVEIRKVFGPLEKLTMLVAVSAVSFLQRIRNEKTSFGLWIGWRSITPSFKWLNRLYCAPIWLDARLFPRSMAAVLLIRAVKKR
jgi:SAM-dependent methyltransferase